MKKSELASQLILKTKTDKISDLTKINLISIGFLGIFLLLESILGILSWQKLVPFACFYFLLVLTLFGFRLLPEKLTKFSNAVFNLLYLTFLIFLAINVQSPVVMFFFLVPVISGAFFLGDVAYSLTCLFVLSAGSAVFLLHDSLFSFSTLGEIILYGVILAFVVAMARALAWQTIALRKNWKELSQKSTMLSNERNELLEMVDNLSDGLIVVDTKKIITTINKSALGSVGATEANNFIGKNIDDLLNMIENDKKIEVVEEVISKNVPISKEDIRLFHNERAATISLRATPLNAANGKVLGAILLFRDVTKYKEIDAQRAEFNAIASHELRTPLTIIKAYASNIRTDSTLKYDQGTAEGIDAIIKATDSLIDLTNDILTVTRADNDLINIYLEKGDVNVLANEALGVVEDSAKEKKLKIVKNFEEVQVIYLDPQKVREVMANLIDNAIKFTEKGTITLKTTEEKGFIKFSVTDTGVGIAENQKEMVFKKFFRAEDWSTRKTGGTGLGLYIAKTYTERMGGTIGFESKAGKGSTFWFTIPITVSLARQKKERQKKLDEFVSNI